MILASDYSLPLQDCFIELFEKEISRIDIQNKDGCILIYFDPSYSYKDCGFYPSQIAVSDTGEILYIAQLAYYKKRNLIKLGRKLHFNFLCDIYQHKGRNCSRRIIEKLFYHWQINFVFNHKLGLFELLIDDLNIFEI